MSSSDQNIERIAAYIAENRAAYSIEALRAQLLASGYNAADVEAAIARSEAPPEQPLPAAIPPTIVVSPALPAPTDPDDEAAITRIAEYLERNRRQYTLEALRLQVLGQGQRPELVEAALARVAPPQQPGAPKRRRWPLVLLVAVANIVLLPAVTGALSYLATIIAGSDFVVTIGSLAVLTELVVAVVLLFNPRWRWLGIGLLLGLLLAAAILAALVVIGIVLFLSWCATLLNS